MNQADKRRIAREARQQKALERLGTTDPRCVECGVTDWRCLERHHIAGRAYGEETVILCRNCHRKQSDSQKDHAPRVSEDEPPLLERIGHWLLGLADFFEELVKRMREYGRALIEAARSCPAPYGCL